MEMLARRLSTHKQATGLISANVNKWRQMRQTEDHWLLCHVDICLGKTSLIVLVSALSTYSSHRGNPSKEDVL